MSYDTSVEQVGQGRFDVVVTTVFSDGARRAVVGTHGTRQKAELAASVVDRSAKRYRAVGNTTKGAATFADPDHR